MKGLAVIGSSAFVGVMLTIGLGLGGFFLQSEPAVFEAWFADYFWLLLGPVFLTSVPAFIGTIAMVRRTEKGTSARLLWRTSLIGLVAAYGITAVVHLPLNFSFWSFTLSDDDLTRNLYVWLLFHVVRLGAAFVAALYAFRAVSGTTSGGEWA